MELNLIDNTLFGNDVAEDEDETIFFSYAIRKTEITQFTSDSKLLIATGLKGEGKSALLRLAEQDFKNRQNAMTIHAKSSSIAPKISSTDQDEWVEAWKESICISVAEKIGETIGFFTISPDKDMLKRIAIESGTKSQNIISKMIAGIKLKAYAGAGGFDAGIEVTAPSPSSPRSLSSVIGRALSENSEIYILLDDIDHNFENTKQNRAKIAGLLTASRYLANETPQLKFRFTLRDNVWSIIKKEYASMSHISQYIVSLKWTDSELNDMLAQRIRAYAGRSNLNIQHISNKKDVIRLAFSNGEWAGESDVDAIRPLATFSQRRPRWFLELCKLSAKNANNRFQKTITFDNITGVSEEYGRKILTDMSVEYICEQPKIADYFNAFMGQASKFKYKELITTIQNRIVEGMPEPKQLALQIANFLFYIGFISARENIDESHYKHYSYADQPNFLTQNYPENEKVDWEVQTIFRGYLKLKTPGRMNQNSKFDSRKQKTK